MRRPVLPLVETRPFLAPGRFEYCGDDEPLHDYILERYEPLAPTGGRLRGVNLLYTSFAVAGVEEQGRALVTAIRDALGPFRTVWA